MKWRQISTRHIFLAILFAALASSFVALHRQRVQLSQRQQAVIAHANQVDSDDLKFKVLRGLSVESERQREAMQTLLNNWNELNWRRDGLWPIVDGRKLNSMIFTNSQKMDGTTITVLVLMDWENNKAVDALSFVSDSKTEQHSCSERFDELDQYQVELLTYPLDDFSSVRNRAQWTLGTSCILEPHANDRTK